MVDGKKLMADAKFYEAYSRWMDDKERYETWDESVERVMQMHRRKFADKMSPDAIKALTTDVKQGHVPPRHIAGAVHKQEPWKPQLGYKGNVSRIAELNAFPPLVLPTTTEGSAKKAKRL